MDTNVKDFYILLVIVISVSILLLSLIVASYFRSEEYAARKAMELGYEQVTEVREVTSKETIVVWKKKEH
jgi:hypothetical protein